SRTYRTLICCVATSPTTAPPSTCTVPGGIGTMAPSMGDVMLQVSVWPVSGITTEFGFGRPLTRAAAANTTPPATISRERVILSLLHADDGRPFDADRPRGDGWSPPPSPPPVGSVMPGPSGPPKAQSKTITLCAIRRAYDQGQVEKYF